MTSPSPFEDPRKADLRDRCRRGIDEAGHELVDVPALISLPESLNLKGSIKGDLQSLDGEGIRYVYYVRPTPNRSLPQWLANLARAALDIADIRLYVVVDEVTAVIEKSCKAAGMGLLRLTEDGSFDHLVNPADFTAEALEKQCRERVKDLRRRLETKFEINFNLVDDNYKRVNEITSGMPPEVRDEYIKQVEASALRWREWADSVSVELDEAFVSCDEDQLRVIERSISEGPLEAESTSGDGG